MKWRGREFKPRGSNKKYKQLDDFDNVYWLMTEGGMSPKQAADHLEVPPSCVLFLIDKYCTEEEKSRINWARARHKNYGRKKNGK